jgi:hypothetical protein
MIREAVWRRPSVSASCRPCEAIARAIHVAAERRRYPPANSTPAPERLSVRHVAFA